MSRPRRLPPRSLRFRLSSGSVVELDLATIRDIRISTGASGDEVFSLAYGVATFGSLDRAFTVGLGYGFASFGPRFMGSRLSADLGVGLFFEEGESGPFLFPLVNFVYSW